MTTATRPATLSSAEVCRSTGLSFRQLDYWCRMRWLRPYQPNEGSGRPGRQWTQAEVDVARMMARLVLLGVTAQRAAAVARDPQQRWTWLAKVTSAVEGWP